MHIKSLRSDHIESQVTPSEESTNANNADKDVALKIVESNEQQKQPIQYSVLS
jgi:hypothetical protein